MLIRDLMTKNPACCKPTDTLDAVAKQMLDHDCGEIPVCDGPKLVGVITDRDITTRAVATGKHPHDTVVRDVMSPNVASIRDDRNLDDAIAIMEKVLVRRLPVLDAHGKLVGIVSQADLVAKVPSDRVARAMKSVAKKTRREHAVA